MTVFDQRKVNMQEIIIHRISYSPWSWSIDYDIQKELRKRFESLHGEKISETEEE